MGARRSVIEAHDVHVGDQDDARVCVGKMRMGRVRNKDSIVGMEWIGMRWEMKKKEQDDGTGRKRKRKREEE